MRTLDFQGHREIPPENKSAVCAVEISGSYEYQVCTELTGQCVPEKVNFVDKIAVTGESKSVAKAKIKKCQQGQGAPGDEYQSA